MKKVVITLVVDEHDYGEFNHREPKTLTNREVGDWYINVLDGLDYGVDSSPSECRVISVEVS